MKKEEPKQFPRLESDEDAERFVEEADLSEYDFSDFQPMSFEFVAEEKATRARIFHQTVRQIKEQNAETNPEELQALIDEAVAWARAKNPNL